MKNEPVKEGETVWPKLGIFMPYWNPGATVIRVGTPIAYEHDAPRIPGGDWVVISSYNGWLPRKKFVNYDPHNR